MSYQVLARKWRPKQFSELVGQEHVVRALSNALNADRTHHAYLFAGTRGIGKTTIARIFAKSINCERGQSAEPCGVCDVCTAVDAGRFVDLLEIDAASNTGVDDVRELIENAQYAPSRGRFKVYLIDEVHMLSRSAFNALLKTLEEPPEHVKFLLATTDPDKLPMTVLSRCLKFNLKRLRPQQIGGQLTHILEAEGIAFDAPAVDALALAADGSMRDGLSLLDQSLAYGGGSLHAEPTRAMLGTVEHAQVLALLGALADGDGAAVMAEAGRIGEHAPDFAGVLGQLAALLHRVQLQQLVPGYHEAPPAQRDALAQLATALAPEQVQLCYQLATHGRRELELAPDGQTGFEMVLLRMLAFRPTTVAGPAAPPAARVRPVRADAKSPPPAAAPAVREAPASASSPAASPAPVVSPPAVAPDQTTLFRDGKRWADDWHAWVDGNPLTGPAGELARNAMLQNIDGIVWTLALRAQLMSLVLEPVTRVLQEKLQSCLGRDVRLVFKPAAELADTPAGRREESAQARQAQAEQSLRDDPLVHGLEAELGARIIPQSVQPL